MGYVREIVDSSFSVAERTAGTYVEKARALAAERVPETTQKFESLVVDLCARAMPLVDEVDNRVDSTLASAVEIKEAQLQRAKDTVQYAQQQTEEKIQLARDVKADLQTKLQETRELTEEKIQLARSKTEEKKAELQAKLQETRELTEAKLLDTYTTAKTQAQETTEAKLQEVQTKLEEVKSTVVEQYEQKKELVQRTKADGLKRYETGKEAVFTKVQETKAEVQSQVQAVVDDGSVTKLSLVQTLLERVAGTRYQQTTNRLIEAADMVLTKSLTVLPAALPRTLDEMKLLLPEGVKHSLSKAQAFEEPLREKLEAAKTRAKELAGRASSSYGDLREQASGVYTTARGELEAKYETVKEAVAPHAAAAQERVTGLATEAQERVATAKTHLQTEAQALVTTYSEPTKQALVNVFGKEVVASSYEKARPLLPVALAEWMAEVDGLD